MKHVHVTRTILLLMVLLSSLGTYAQNAMVGDGFGGRSGYSPVNYNLGYLTGYAVCGPTKQLSAWGANANASFGTGSTTAYQTWTPVTSNSTWSNLRQIAPSTNSFNAAIKEDGTGWIWGASWPNGLQLITDAAFVDAGQHIVSFVKTDGTVWSVGSNSIGLIGDGTTTSATAAFIETPTQMTGITTAKRIAVGYSTGGLLSYSFSLILLADGTVKQVGYLAGSTSPYNSKTPVTVPGLSNIVDVKIFGFNTAYALNASGQVYTWTPTAPTPTLMTFPAGAGPIKAIIARAYVEGSAFAIDDNGKLYGWGYNNFGQLGIGTLGTSLTPKLVTTNVRDVKTTTNFTYIFKTDGTLWATGELYTNRTGLNYQTAGSVLTPVQLTPTVSPYNLCAPTAFNGMPPCLAGTTAPAVTPASATNTCPATTVSLASLPVSSTTPAGASLIWSTSKVPASAADTLTTAQAGAVSTAGKYYAMYYDKANSCYSPADSVVLTINSCITSLSANSPATQTATTGTAKTGNAATELAPTGGTAPYVYSNGAGDAACVAPSGATALTGLTVNANGSYSYTAPTTAGTYYYCIKVCDSATPTASCVVKTYTLTVTAPACTVAGIVPAILKN